MRTLTAIRYQTPLREGGSLPAVVEADDGRLWVAKFAGAGQGTRALVAEWVVGELARVLGLNVPEIVALEFDGAFGRNERDPEIRDLLQASIGTNLALAFLPGAIAYDPVAPPAVDADTASAIVWLDACTLNVDRTPRNPNLLLWQGGLWLIDHGAALYFHHAWGGAAAHAASPFTLVRQHVLLRAASRVAERAAELRSGTEAALAGGLLDAIPDAWLPPDPTVGDAAAQRAAYAIWLRTRLAATDSFVTEVGRARAELV